MNSAGSIPVFRNTPLNEVVLGVQFMPVRGYQQIHAGDVWRLFEHAYPLVEEHPALQPFFEVFGGPPTLHPDFGISVGATHDRFWFVSPDRHDLLQFQNDRFLHNWRKFGDNEQNYPRFSVLIEKFASEATILEEHFRRKFLQGLAVNQCELSYTNHIPVWKYQDLRPDVWINFFKLDTHKIEDFSAGFRRIVLRSDGTPSGRLYCHATAALDARGRSIIALALTARGVPKEPNLSGALEFLRESRDMLVNLFAEVTTDSAHMAWERIR